MTRTCTNCGMVNDSDAGYCVGCGAILKCPKCRFALENPGKYCGACGFFLETKQADCEQCLHYCPSLHISSRLKFMPSAEASEALSVIQKEERTLEAQEFSTKKDRALSDEIEWGQRQHPVMSAYCAEHADENQYEIVELKNQDGYCQDFAPADTIPKWCTNCVRQVAFFPSPMVYSGPNGNIALDNERRKDWYRRYAAEILSAWTGRGRLLNTPQFNDYCAVYPAHTICVYANPYGSCIYHEPK